MGDLWCLELRVKYTSGTCRGSQGCYQVPHLLFSCGCSEQIEPGFSRRIRLRCSDAQMLRYSDAQMLRQIEPGFPTDRPQSLFYFVPPKSLSQADWAWLEQIEQIKLGFPRRIRLGFYLKGCCPTGWSGLQQLKKQLIIALFERTFKWWSMVGFVLGGYFWVIWGKDHLMVLALKGKEILG